MSLTMAETARCGRTGKVGFSFADAERIAQRARRRRGERMTVFRCRHCRAWHVGHSDGKPR